MYSGADGLIALLGANDGHCYQSAMLRPCRTASHSESTTCTGVTMAPWWYYFGKQPAAAIPYSSEK